MIGRSAHDLRSESGIFESPDRGAAAPSGTLPPVEKAERKQIMAVWGVREESPRERIERERLEADLEGSPLVGKPLRQRLRNFTVAPDAYIRALNGPLPYMARLRTIEEEEARHERELLEAWQELSRAYALDAEGFARRWRAEACRPRFEAVNALIDEHNRWYPMEARLPMDPRRRDFALVNGKPYRRRRLDAAWVLERFPAELPG